MRRFARLAHGFPKKIEKHAAAAALYFMHYNFFRIHKTLRCTPAMAAKVGSRVLAVSNLMQTSQV
jgi:hypothetical protein